MTVIGVLLLHAGAYELLHTLVSSCLLTMHVEICLGIAHANVL